MNIFHTAGKGKLLIFSVVVFVLVLVTSFFCIFQEKLQESQVRIENRKSLGDKDKHLSSQSNETDQSDQPTRKLAKVEKLETETAQEQSSQETSSQKEIVVAWQPSHQDDTGRDWHEYEICGDIVDNAMSKASKVQNIKCWDLTHGLTGSNNYRPVPTNTIAFDSEIEQANQAGASYFISIHNDGGAPSGILGEYMPGDNAGKELAQELVAALCDKTGLPNRGLRPVRLYSLEAPRNKAQYRCLLEIGDNEKDRVFLQDPRNQDLIGQALADVVNGFSQ